MFAKALSKPRHLHCRLTYCSSIIILLYLFFVCKIVTFSAIHILYRILLMDTDVSVPLGLRATAVKSTLMTVSQTLAEMEQHAL